MDSADDAYPRGQRVEDLEFCPPIHSGRQCTHFRYMWAHQARSHRRNVETGVFSVIFCFTFFTSPRRYLPDLFRETSSALSSRRRSSSQILCIRYIVALHCWASCERFITQIVWLHRDSNPRPNPENLSRSRRKSPGLPGKSVARRLLLRGGNGVLSEAT